MDSRFALGAVGDLYAQVFDQACTSPEFAELSQSIAKRDSEAQTLNKLDALSGKIAALLVQTIDQSEEFSLEIAPEVSPERFGFDVVKRKESAKSASALSQIAKHFGLALDPDAAGPFRIDSPDLARDLRAVAAIALGRDLKVECTDLSLPVIEGDERSDITTTTTFLGELGYASEAAIGKWLTHMSDPGVGKMTTFLIYERRNGGKLQIKYLEDERCFVLLTVSGGERDVRKIESPESAAVEIREWFHGDRK